MFSCFSWSSPSYDPINDMKLRKSIEDRSYIIYMAALIDYDGLCVIKLYDLEDPELSRYKYKMVYIGVTSDKNKEFYIPSWNVTKQDVHNKIKRILREPIQENNEEIAKKIAKIKASIYN